MKFLAIFVIFMVVFTLALGERTCTIDGRTIKAGQSHQPAGQCSIYKCTDEGLFSITNCPPVPTFTGKGKFIDKDVKKPFPDCCARVIQ
ncbi:venom peptide Pc-like isoform X1 [Musca domestica]|uniref:Venom peptide Pc-like isoform X1 n=1 Tax=Musca domestica TaxID=7370 RepID=A0A9J7D6Z8_MUSDO|nr:venom peptide Pc-like isoform X1 [Musca domestica]